MRIFRANGGMMNNSSVNGNMINGNKWNGNERDIWDGVQIKTQLDNGRAVIELSLWTLSEQMEGADCFPIYLWDAKEQLVFYCEHPAREEDPCMIPLLHPHLWECDANPYLYRLEIYEREEKREVCLGSFALPVRQLTYMSDNSYLFNGRRFEPKAVLYDGICEQSAAGRELFWGQIEHKLQQLVQMGADTLVLESLSGASREEAFKIRDLCNKKGLLLWIREEGDMQDFRGGIEGRKLFTGGNLPTPHYYLQKARWSKEPFVYIHAGSMEKKSDGCCTITVYSNAKRVALLLNGKVFEFQEDGPKFVFQDVPVKSLPLMLTAEAGDCSMSVACY